MDDGSLDHPDETSYAALIDGAVRDALSAGNRARLDRHVAECPTCAAELETRRVFAAALAPGPDDDSLNRAAVERAMQRLDAEATPGASTASAVSKDEAFNRAAVERAMASLAPLAQRRTDRRRRWVSAALTAGAVAAGAAVVLLVLVQGHRRSSPPQPATLARAAGSRALILADESEIASDDSTADIQVAEQTAARTTVRLRSGAARFHVRHDGRRLFRVDAGPIPIDDLGTAFRIAHEAGGRVRVQVTEGRVAVLDVARQVRLELGVGDDRVFSGAGEPRYPARSADAPRAPTPATPTMPTRVRPADNPTDLLAAADLARRIRPATSGRRSTAAAHRAVPDQSAGAVGRVHTRLAIPDRPRPTARGGGRVRRRGAARRAGCPGRGRRRTRGRGLAEGG